MQIGELALGGGGAHSAAGIGGVAGAPPHFLSLGADSSW
jgi:hypothetical protein